MARAAGERGVVRRGREEEQLGDRVDRAGGAHVDVHGVMMPWRVSRFAEPQHPVFRQLNSSIGFDWRLGPYDIEQSRAHATMLAAAGIISDADRDALLHGLDARRGGARRRERSAFDDEDEDIHMAVERRLTEIVGPVGGKLHTARSRNDQVATDVAMFTRAHALQTLHKLQHLQSVIVQLAARHEDWAMPGYTHLQRAQPVYLSHHLLAYFWMFRRDASRFEFVLGATSELPLGAGALAGVNFPTDRQLVARELGFASGRAELDRRGLQPRLRARLPRPPRRPARRTSRGWARRSSSGPRRSSASARSPTPGPRAPRSCRRRRTPTRPSSCARRRRASPPRLGALHGVMHGLPLTYNKDMQEDKEHLFDAVDTLDLCLQAAAGMLETIAFDRERLAAAAADELIAATDIADLLVKRGVPFRQSHGIVAGIVRETLASGRTLSDLGREELARHSEVLDDEFYAVLSQQSWLESKVSEGGTSLARVREQLSHARAELEGQPAA